MGEGYGDFEKMCSDLAEQGYYAEFIEYFTQTGAVTAFQPEELATKFPTWMAVVDAGIDSLAKNPTVDPKRIGLMGFSLGAYLSIAVGGQGTGKVAAIIDYYGGIWQGPNITLRNLPPTLILHGGRDTIVPVKSARDLDDLLAKQNIAHEIHIYPTCGHAFNFRELTMLYDSSAANDAWERSLKFLAQALGNAKLTT